MNLTRYALSSERFTAVAALLILLAGSLTFMNFPSQEEPSVTVREAQVSVAYPGMPSERVERYLAQPLEEKLRGVAGIKSIVTTVRPGSAVVQVTAYDDVHDLRELWQRVRALTSELSGVLPSGTLGPFVDDDYGRVAVASVAITTTGYRTNEIRQTIRSLRDRLYALPGTDKVSIIGLQDELIYVDFDKNRLAALGLTPAAILGQLRSQNVIEPGGLVSVSGLAITSTITGGVRGETDLRDFKVSVPGSLGILREVTLGEIGTVSMRPVDPPESAVIYKGKPAVVLAISMAAGQSVEAYGKAIKAELERAKTKLPVGFELNIVTFQADVVAREMSRMHHVMGETVVIVMAVVMLFLGIRTGLVVGSIVPLTIFSSLIVMRMLDVELQSVSMAAIILALGLLVDNGIVIAEDVERRLAAGEDRRAACEMAGKTLAVPLLTSSVAIILAFSPFFFGQTSTNEYLRSLAVVLATTLLGSWLISITVIPLLCMKFAVVPAEHAENQKQYSSAFYKSYRQIVVWLLQHKAIYIGSMTAALVAAVFVLQTRPYDFLPRSDRLQFQIPVVLQPGADSRKTLAAITQISLWLADKQKNPEITDSVGYVAEGGPRIVLGLNPPLPGPNVGYFTVNVRPGTELDKVILRTQDYLKNGYPELVAQPQRFSLGSSEPGVAVYRVSGTDEETLRRIAGKIGALLRATRGTTDVQDDWQTRVPRYIVEVDQQKARLGGVSGSDVAQSLRLRYGGESVSAAYADAAIPIIFRSSPMATDGNPLDTLVYSSATGVSVPLAAISRIRQESEPGIIVRRNLVRTITVKGYNAVLTADEIVQRLSQNIKNIDLPPGFKIEVGGELEESAETNQALFQYFPHALIAIVLLFVWQFNSFRKLLIVFGSIPFVIVGASLALLVSGQPFGFMPSFGLMALAGIIVNNAVLLLERIEVERAAGLPVREAVVTASVMRLRPIIMTKLTCIVGLLPLMLFAGSLWTGMAITMIGGLALGTLVTLGLIPVLYVLLMETLPGMHKTLVGELSRP